MKLKLLYFAVLAYVVSLFGLRWFQNQPTVLSSSALSAPVQFTAVPNAPNPNQLFDLVNFQRASAGVNQLEPDAQLMGVAEARAKDMVQRRYYAHRDPDQKHFGHLLTEAQITASYSCENLHLNFTLEPQQYIDDWLVSTTGHRSCLLHPDVSRAGYAVAIWDNVSVVGTPQKAYVIVAIHASN